MTAQRSGAQSGQRHRERFGHLVAVEAQSAGLVVVDVRNDRHNGGRVVRLDELTVAPDLVGGAARGARWDLEAWQVGKNEGFYDRFS